ncbi:MAG: hypothetical protein PVJ76_20415, partial [Gemmatimonadota bacterium]
AVQASHAEPDDGKAGDGKRSLAPAIANWVVNELLRELKGRSLLEVPITPERLAAHVALLEGGTISQPVAKDIFQEMVAEGVDPRVVVEKRGLEKIDDPDLLEAMVRKALDSNPEKVQEYRDGKKGLLGFFMGQVMKETGGKADPKVVNGLLRQTLDG